MSDSTIAKPVKTDLVDALRFVLSLLPKYSTCRDIATGRACRTVAIGLRYECDVHATEDYIPLEYDLEKLRNAISLAKVRP